jgi:hypothetical protein
MIILINIVHTSSLWHSIIESFDGSLREDRGYGKDDDNVMFLTPRSQPVGDRVTFPPIARPSI